MTTISCADLRENLDACLDRVYADREPVVIVRQGNRNVVLMAAEDYDDGWAETDYLLAEPANAAHLAKSIAQYRAGQDRPRELCR